MIGTVTEAALRQILYAAVAAKDTARARRVMLWWVGSNVTFGLMTATMLFLAATMLVTLLLAEEYRETATLILPWLLFGHIPLLAAQPLQVLAYANHRTREITMVQAVCAVMAVGLAAIGAWWNGILGVAIAVPIYFSAQFLLTALVAAQQSRARA
jgi:O-antigen/teichoic acid export membrane protein